MNAPTLPLNLYKANVALQLDIARLLHEGGHGWLEAAREFSADGLAGTGEQIDSLRRATDWQALTTVPSELSWHLLQGQMNESQALTQLAIRSQIAFTNGLQQALAGWQQAVAEAFGDKAEADPFVEVLRQWTQPWIDATAAAAPKTGK